MQKKGECNVCKNAKGEDLCANRKSAGVYVQINPKCVQKSANVCKGANARMHGLNARLIRAGVCAKCKKRGSKCNFRKL